jgi:hypothetical protein
MIFSENRYPPRIKPGAGFFGIMLYRSTLRVSRMEYVMAYEFSLSGNSLICVI